MPGAIFYEVALRNAADAYRVAREVRLRANRDRFLNAPACAKALAGSVRDLVAWRCTRLAGHDCEDLYIAWLDHAFDGGLSGDKDLKSQLLNSFHHIVGGADEAFKSHSSQRRRRRPPRQSRGGDLHALMWMSQKPMAVAKHAQHHSLARVCPPCPHSRQRVP